ncbi:MAG: flagellar export chaperone FliS [Spirochaetaceae bacterium]|jgi:flagellar protein FliS|nr:flagellar export chaperone FliS [Spirochaetaceae bacterium]
MANISALSAYRQTRIKTASQGQLIIMLYDGGISTLDHALELLRHKSERRKDPSKIEEIGKAIIKAQEIITELMVSLDFEQGGKIAENLFALYTWFNKELLEAHITSDAARILAVRNSLFDIRKSWAEIIAKNSAKERLETESGINIAG